MPGMNRKGPEGAGLAPVAAEGYAEGPGRRPRPLQGRGRGSAARVRAEDWDRGGAAAVSARCAADSGRPGRANVCRYTQIEPG